MTDDPIPSPCTKVCQIDPRTGWCLGCWRTGEEIGAWPGLDNAGRRALLDRLPPRQTAWQAAPRKAC
jgi:predicted Fe-S protein YdhL (DUF1289 family)